MNMTRKYSFEQYSDPADSEVSTDDAVCIVNSPVLGYLGDTCRFQHLLQGIFQKVSLFIIKKNKFSGFEIVQASFCYA